MVNFLSALGLHDSVVGGIFCRMKGFAKKLVIAHSDSDDQCCKVLFLLQFFPFSAVATTMSPIRDQVE